MSADDEVEVILAEPEQLSQWDRMIGFILSPLTLWSFLALTIIIILQWNRINKYLDKLYEKNQQQEYAARVHKDPDWVVSNYERMEMARRKMQAQYNDQLIQAVEKEKVKQKEKLLNSSYTKENGYRLGDSNNVKTSKADYSPLMGDSSGKYRPQKRSTCPGGGCG